MSLPRVPAHRHCRMRPFAVLAVATILAALFAAVVAQATPAHAAPYRFWSYYQLESGAWKFATKGPAQTTPADGAVEGWRYAVSELSSPRFPRAALPFTDICATTAAAAGKKRVGVVLDFGRGVDGELSADPPAPLARCALVDAKASGAQVLAAVATVRVGKGQVCGVNGYPASGCGGTVPGLSAAMRAPDEPVAIVPAGARNEAESGWNIGSWAALVIVVASVSGMVAVLVRRRSRAPRR